MNTEAPKINEYWHVAYGTKIKTNIIVKVCEDKTNFNPKNWRQNQFDCERLGNNLIVSGNMFIERMDS